MPEGATAVVTAKPGNPEEGSWTPKAATIADAVCRSDLNTYFNCSSVRRQEDGTLAARKECSAAYHALVLDDVGTKVERSLLGDLEPTWEIETSPGNYQVGFKLDPPLPTPEEVERLQRQIAKAGLTDTGALGMVRWARLPNGVNGKPKYERDGKPFQCRLTGWNPETRYSAHAIVEALVPTRPERPHAARAAVRPAVRHNTGNDVYVPRADINPVILALKEQGLYKREISPGRHEVTCPWVAEHTDELDTGAAYFEPDDGHPRGGFCCQHSHKDQYHIAELLDHLDLSQEEARNRPVIRVKEGELDTILSACEDVLAQEGDLYQSGGMIVSVSVDPLSGDPSLTPVGETALTRKLSHLCDWQKYNVKAEKWVPCDPPP